MPKHAAELDAAIMTSCATGLDTLNVHPILEESGCLTELHFVPVPNDIILLCARYTARHSCGMTERPRKTPISVYFHKRDGVLTPKSIPAETVRYQEQTLLATLCACQTLLLPRERQQYNEVAISMVTTTRSTGYTKWRCLRRRKGRAIYREELERKIQCYPVYT